ncbi:hypothetical protein [Herbaspirillum sp. ST 5-3]|uniref:phage tail tube protein n=1 Tax=Oxalobacteraceae TaxID=75682 RepID=UPI0010A48D14|nr:hypothetical protein [Herbaspirillum sp. ST 5-3]
MPNLIATPRKWKNKAILVKTEAAYGTDAAPTGAANWIEARNVTLTPMDVDKVERNIEMPYMGNSGSVVVGKWAKLSFDVAMVGSGAAGTAPKWGPLMLACGTSETIAAATSSAYNVVSAAFGSASCYINIDGTLHKLTGMRGEVKGKMAAKGIPMLSFSFDSLYIAPLAEDLPAVTRTGWQLEEGVNSANTLPLTLNGIDLAFSSLDWSFGNKMARINLPGPQVEVAITDRAPQASVTVLAPDLGTFDPFALVDAGTVVDLTTTHGSAAGKKVQTDIKAKLIGVDYDKIDDLLAYKITLEPTPSVGNDEIVLTAL